MKSPRKDFHSSLLLSIPQVYTFSSSSSHVKDLRMLLTIKRGEQRAEIDFIIRESSLLTDQLATHR
jgi:hypothetical protein